MKFLAIICTLFFSFAAHAETVWMYEFDRAIVQTEHGVIDSAEDETSMSGQLTVFEEAYKIDGEICADGHCFAIYDMRIINHVNESREIIYTTKEDGESGQIRILSIDPLIVAWDNIIVRFTHVEDIEN